MFRNTLLFAFIYIVFLPSSQACDTPVIFENADLTAKTILDPETQKYKIIIDSDTPELVGEDAMRFLIAHECAHIELVHIIQANEAMTRLSPIELSHIITAMELEADCHSVKKLMKTGDKKAINALLKFIADSSDTYTKRASVYASIKRIRNIQRCIAAEEKANNKS